MPGPSTSAGSGSKSRESRTKGIEKKKFKQLLNPKEPTSGQTKVAEKKAADKIKRDERKERLAAEGALKSPTTGSEKVTKGEKAVDKKGKASKARDLLRKAERGLKGGL